jgi:hypothetical protein
MINIKKDILEYRINNSAKIFYIYLEHTKRYNKSNAYYADAFEVSTMTVNNWINELKDTGLIEITFEDNKRKIKINE